MAFGFGYYGIGLIAVVAAIIIPRIPHINKKSPEASAYRVTDTADIN